MKLNQLRPSAGARKRHKRRGCGVGSGHGKTSTRGHKGAGQHSASEYDARFEGGQMPFYRRIPKRGFVQPGRIEYSVVNLDDLSALTETTITPDLLVARRVVRKGMPVKVLGRGELSQALTVTAHAFSGPAKEKIEKAGGRVEVVK